MTDFWVFGYGSLMWRPGFAFEEQRRARIHGAHRSLCVYSYVHRGTPERPGLVLGLDRGGSCWGTAFRVRGPDRDEVISYLRGREQVTMVYLEVVRRVTLSTGGEVEAVCYVADRTHEQYAGRLPIAEQARIVLQGVGGSGRNPEYLENMVRHLDEIGLPDRTLHRIHQAVQAGSNCA
ncbi:MAG: gamma-glutamylcyclotransferase [Hyphomicrobiales bacterium]